MNMIDKNRAAWTEACDARMAQLAPPECPKPSGMVAETIAAVFLLVVFVMVFGLIGAAIVEPGWLLSWRDVAMIFVGAVVAAASLTAIAACVAGRLPGWDE